MGDPFDSMTEQEVMVEINKCNQAAEKHLDKIELLIKRGFAMSSPEVQRLQKKLHQIEIRSNAARTVMIRKFL
jgi:hypothetical protein